MILIAESGSTKTDWYLLSHSSENLLAQTSGINPYFLSKKQIFELLSNELPWENEIPGKIYFYGAGCTPEKQGFMRETLSQYFQTENIEVYSDLLAAARSLCQKKEGIACILGTGSNSCYYNGENIVQNVSPLGFILGDEGSGAVLGKKLLGDVLKKQLPETIVRDFHQTYGLETANILERVYRQPAPNRFLAQFAPFLHKHIQDPSIANLVNTSFREFILRNVGQYKNSDSLPIHFTGSIAFNFQENLKQILTELGFIVGTISQNPMDGLIEYHKQ